MNKPHPVINELSAPYWQAVERGELALQRCQSCRHWIHFPEPRCPQCANRDLQFQPVSGKGEIETFSVIHRSFVEGFGPDPYIIAWVALPEQPGLRVMCNIIHCAIDEVSIGRQVDLCFEQRGEFGQLPQFRLSSHSPQD